MKCRDEMYFMGSICCLSKLSVEKISCDLIYILYINCNLDYLR
jgi:hypothetical protein